MNWGESFIGHVRGLRDSGAGVWMWRRHLRPAHNRYILLFVSSWQVQSQSILSVDCKCIEIITVWNRIVMHYALFSTVDFSLVITLVGFQTEIVPWSQSDHVTSSHNNSSFLVCLSSRVQSVSGAGAINPQRWNPQTSKRQIPVSITTVCWFKSWQWLNSINRDCRFLLSIRGIQYEIIF